jgi:hypothetical protein
MFWSFQFLTFWLPFWCSDLFRLFMFCQLSFWPPLVFLSQRCHRVIIIVGILFEISCLSSVLCHFPDVNVRMVVSAWPAARSRPLALPAVTLVQKVQNVRSSKMELTNAFVRLEKVANIAMKVGFIDYFNKIKAIGIKYLFKNQPNTISTTIFRSLIKLTKITN